MSFKNYALGACAASLICLQACGGDAKADASTPSGAIMSNVQALQSNDISAYVDSLLSAEQKSKLAAKWDEQRTSNPPSDMEKEQFETQMESLLSGKMIEEMMPMVEAQLAEVNSEQLSGMVSMFGGMALNSPDLDEAQKAQIGQLVSSLSEWVKKSDVCNPENVRTALKSIQNTAKKLNIHTLDDVMALNFDQLVDKGDVVFAGVKGALNVYGISIDDVLKSVKVDKVEAAGDITNVTVSYEIFGTKQTATTALKNVGGKWIETTMAAKMDEAFAGM